ncbi:hypothetical protein IFR05_004987 [Cadophora sp. M221]|nr:hypothetical protein IFR05_004987 [Cadophora sp. M221]
MFNPLIFCATALLLTFQASTAAASNFAIDNLVFYGVWLSAGSNTSILRFESTLIIPSSPPDTSTEDNIQAFWPGLEPADNDSVFQNVVTNQGGEAGEWYLLPFSCCSPAKALTPQMRVHPGDSLTNIFALDVPTGKWYDNYLVTPSRTAVDREDGIVPYGGGFTFDPIADAALKHKPLTSTLMTIELQERGKWNFGAVEWRNILVEADTMETKWCEEYVFSLSPFLLLVFSILRKMYSYVHPDNIKMIYAYEIFCSGPVPTGGRGFKRRYSMPTWNTVGSTTTCHIAQMIFEGPDDAE